MLESCAIGRGFGKPCWDGLEMVWERFTLRDGGIGGCVVGELTGLGDGGWDVDARVEAALHGSIWREGEVDTVDAAQSCRVFTVVANPGEFWLEDFRHGFKDRFPFTSVGDLLYKEW